MLCGRKSVAIATVILFVFSAALVLRIFPESREASSQWVQSLRGQSYRYCPENVDWLHELDLTFPIAYARRDILIRPRPGVKRETLTRVHEKLFPPFQSLDIIDDATARLKYCKAPLVLELPASPSENTKASHILFGLIASLPELEAAILQLQRWLPGSEAKFFAIITPDAGSQAANISSREAQGMTTVQSRMKELDMNVELLRSSDLSSSSDVDSLTLVKTLYDKRQGTTQWISLINKDTFFPSIPALASMLSKWNAHEEYYLGGLPDAWGDVMHFGLIGHIGAGIFLSMALVRTMASEYEYCSQATNTMFGDRKITQCINELSETRLTNERELHLLNISGDLSGFYESGRFPVSIHNRQSGAASLEGQNIPMAHQIADLCNECFLQRWQFDDNVILANGYSVSRYSKNSLKAARLDRMEQTWADGATHEASNNPGFDHSLGPTRPPLVLNEEKFQYRLTHSKPVNGGVRQAYFHQGVNGDADGLLEIFWRLEK